MKNIILIGTLLALASASSTAATATSSATVKIDNKPLTLVNTQGLNFGTVLPLGQGSVSVSPAGDPFVVNAVLTDTGGITASSWTVTGEPGVPYTVTLPTVIGLTNGTDFITMDAFTRTGSNVNSQLRLNAAGTGAFNVGARLTLTGNEPAGVYNGTFEVTVNYN